MTIWTDNMLISILFNRSLFTINHHLIISIDLDCTLVKKSLLQLSILFLLKKNIAFIADFSYFSQ